jgi:hypothetical protein
MYDAIKKEITLSSIAIINGTNTLTITDGVARVNGATLADASAITGVTVAVSTNVTAATTNARVVALNINQVPITNAGPAGVKQLIATDTQCTNLCTYPVRDILTYNPSQIISQNVYAATVAIDYNNAEWRSIVCTNPVTITHTNWPIGVGTACWHTVTLTSGTNLPTWPTNIIWYVSDGTTTNVSPISAIPCQVQFVYDGMLDAVNWRAAARY